MDSICEELGIPKQHIRETVHPDRFILVVDTAWLKCLEQQKKVGEFHMYPGLDKRSLPDLEHPWTKVYIQVFKKCDDKVIPLPKNKAETESFSNDLPLTFSQILSYVSSSNYRSIWESAYKKYEGAHLKFGRKPKATDRKHFDQGSNLVAHDMILREAIQRFFSCYIIHSKVDKLKSSPIVDNRLAIAAQHDCHPNLMPALAAIETSCHISVIFYPTKLETSLYDCVTYSPAILNKSHNKPLFIIYQILQLMEHIHDCGLNVGDLRLHDIFLKENLWLQIIPNLESNIIKLDADDSPSEDCSESSKFELKFAYDLQQFSLREYCEMWCNGQLSNFDYLTILNNAAGRRVDCPDYHHIMPWVTDFSQRNGINWRDLSKSKYRINKGDPHLDLMFSSSSSAGSEAPHHVSDFLSEITYFVYMARRTPRHILCQHVRPIWVPAEYPVSIQRLQEWTPDECIPEFYSDPMVFKSIHEDLPDLELPVWTTCPEDFIAKHREALESQYVSERLHHWIDLNFGYKLTGKAAIKAKNVCLSLIDNHKNLCQRGIVQLFIQPHPPKRFPSIWFSKTPPRFSTYDQKRRMTRSSEDLTKIANIDPETYFTSPNRKYSTSPKLAHQIQNSNIPEDSINATTTAIPTAATVAASNIERSSSSYHTNVQKSPNNIILPKDYNPCALLNSLENMESFCAKTFLNQKSNENCSEKLVNNDLMFEESSDNSFTNRIFSEAYEANLLRENKKFLATRPSRNLIVQNSSRNFKQFLYDKRGQDLQVVGCIIVEVFLLNKLRPLTMNSVTIPFEERLKACKMVAQKYFQEIPKCMQYAVKLFLNFDGIVDSAGITQLGLPTPTAHQVLQPLLSNFILPFPVKYMKVYSLIRSLHNFNINSILLSINTHFYCDGTQCSRFIDLDKKRVLFNRKIAECKVKACCTHIEGLLDPVAYEQFSSVELILPHIIDLLRNEETSILTAWYLFDPVATALGVKDTQKYLLEPMLKLYDAENEERITSSSSSSSIKYLKPSMKFSISSSFKSRKSVKLYHHSFLLRLIVRFGLKCFLDNFTPALIEAVGGYKEPEDSSGFHYHSNKFSNVRSSRSTKNLKFCCTDESDNSLTLISPDHSDLKSDTTISFDATSMQQIENVFTFDGELEENSDKTSNNAEYESKSVDSFEMRLNQLSAEEATEDGTSFSPEKLAIDDIINGPQKLSNNSFEDDKISVNSRTDSPSSSKPNLLGPKSPTIPIPSAIRQSYELSTIDCEIGSKKSIDSFDIPTMQDQPDIGESDNSKSKATTPDKSDSLQASVISKMCEMKNAQSNRISEMSTESLIWLSHRLGPVLTARYLTRNLLKMLTLCYVGQENLLPENNNEDDNGNLNYFTIVDARVVGDASAARVLECLTSIAALFGEQFILLQYLPHVSELIALSKRRMTSSLEGAVISSLQLLKYLIPCLMDTTIMEQIQDVFIRNIIMPVIRLLGSTRCLMPSGFLARNILARKLLDAIYVLSVRIGPEMSKEHLCISALQNFFLIFDKAYGILEHFTEKQSMESSFIDLGVQEPSVKSSLKQQTQQQNVPPKSPMKIKTIEQQLISEENISPPTLNEDFFIESGESQLKERALEEIRDVFSPNLAHCAYLAFLRYLGESIMAKTLVNLELVLTLCHEYEQPEYMSNARIKRLQNLSTGNRTIGSEDDFIESNSFGSSVIGNRIDVKHNLPKTEVGPMEVLDMVTYKFEQVNSIRHLRGNWLAYWEHEIGRADKDNHLNLKQIKLQTYAGHTNSVRALLTLDNENSFMSASKDKTVKLWSLRSEGDGKKVSSCQFTYTSHKKSVHSIAFLESIRYVISCDSGVHLWDPFIGRPVGILDSQTKYSPVSVVKAYPSPSPLVLAGTADSTVKIIDSRTISYVNEWKVASNQSSTVRCLASAPSGNWIAIGLSSGNIALLDGRSGMLLGSWKATDGELLQLVAPNDQQIISSSLDHSISVWSINDNCLQYQLKQPPEPAHCLQPNGPELVFATPANRIGVYSDLSTTEGTYTITKLRSESLKGVLTSLSVLPLNRMILAGNDSGNIALLC